MSLYVRTSFKSGDLKNAVNKRLAKKVTRLKTEPGLANALAREWGTATNKYVPRSLEGGHHMQTFAVSDGRVTWSRPARQAEPDIEKGEDLARLLHDNGPTKGHFHKRAEGATEYGSHMPSDHWTEKVRPTGVVSVWKQYVNRATIIIQEWMVTHGDS